MEENIITEDDTLLNDIKHSFLIDKDSKEILLNNPLSDEVRLMLADFFAYYSEKEEEIVEAINLESTKIITKMLDYIQENDEEISALNIDNELLI